MPKGRQIHEFYAHIGVAVSAAGISGLILFRNLPGIIPALSLAFFWLGVSFILDFLLYRNFGYYILPVRKREIPQFLLVAILSIVFCYILEFAGLYATRLWYWRQIPFQIYFLASPFTYLIYPLVLFQLYELVKHLLKHYSRPLIVPELRYKQIIKAELILGMILLFSWTLHAIKNIQRLPVPLTEIRITSGITVPWWFGFAAMISVFLIFEWVGFIRKRNTLTHDILRGDLRPIFAILGAAVIGIIIMEIVNAPFQIWTYDNWPLQNIQISTIPIMVILLWPLHFLGFLAIFSSFLDKKRADIW